MNFEQAFAKLINVEAGFQNNPKDKGNWTGGKVGVGENKGTKYGISAAAYPGEDIAGLSLERAKFLYLRDYWGPAGCDAVPDEIKYDLFDVAVNSGPKTAARMLQKAVGEVQDGVIGPRTLQAVNSMHPARIIARVGGARLLLIAGLQNWDEFGKGLVIRVANNLLEA